MNSRPQAFGSKRTSKGTELPLINLKGKPYLQVAYRLVWFREEHPLGRVETSAIELSKDHSIFQAKIFDAEGRLLGMGTKQETKQGFADHIEKSETGAIGRALAVAGYGTQFEPELDEGERIVDSPIEPVIKAEEQDEDIPFDSRHPGNARDEAYRALMDLYNPFLTKFPQTSFPNMLNLRYGVPETRLMTVAQLSDLVVFMKESLEAGKERPAAQTVKPKSKAGIKPKTTFENFDQSEEK